jgi:hypothetical protein
VAGFGRLAAVEADRRQGASEVENYGRGPWQEGLRNSTLYVTLVALQYKCILAIKSASVPPRGGAREPGRQLSAFLDCANRLLEQTETLCTAAHRGRCDGGNGKNSLAGRVSPSGDLRTQLLRLDVRIELIDHGDLYLWRPLPPI